MSRIFIGLLLLLLFPLTPATAGDFSYPYDPGVPADKLTVLTYHHLEPGATGKHLVNSAIMSVEEFTWQMEYLHKNNFYAISMEEMQGFLAGSVKLPRRSVLITFDDGYESNYTYAFPLLAKYNFKATIFLTGKTPEDGVVQPDLPFYPHLTAFQLKSMHRLGLLEYGCHTFDQHRLVGGRPALTVLGTDEIKADLYQFNKLFAMLGFPVPSVIAYPYGAGSGNASVAAASLGYRLGFTVNSGYVRPGDNPMQINRFSIHPGDGRQYFMDVVQGKWVAPNKQLISVKVPVVDVLPMAKAR